MANSLKFVDARKLLSTTCIFQVRIVRVGKLNLLLLRAYFQVKLLFFHVKKSKRHVKKKQTEKDIWGQKYNRNGSQVKAINIQILATSNLSFSLSECCLTILKWLNNAFQQKSELNHFQWSYLNLWQTTVHKIPSYKIYLFIWIYLSIYSSRFWLQLFIGSDANDSDSRTYTANNTTKVLAKRAVIHSYPRSQDIFLHEVYEVEHQYFLVDIYL